MKKTFTDNERFELLASIFFGKFGVLAPGKDEAAAAPPTPFDDDRYELWANWKPLNDVLDYLLYKEAECDDHLDTIRRMKDGGN